MLMFMLSDMWEPTSDQSVKMYWMDDGETLMESSSWRRRSGMIVGLEPVDHSTIVERPCGVASVRRRASLQAM